MTVSQPALHEPAEDDEPGIGRVVALIFGVVLVALIVAYVVGEERREGGGLSGDQADGNSAPIRIAAVQDFDPHGEGGEHPEEVALAGDGRTATAWTTEQYEATLSLLKPGVGLIFDMGEEVDPTTVEIVMAPAGSDIELRVSDSTGASEDDFELIAEEADASSPVSFDTDGATGRYWLVWITDLPGGSGGTAGIAEVRFLR
jgi:putative peptidoglycan lipid II flippase